MNYTVQEYVATASGDDLQRTVEFRDLQLTNGQEFSGKINNISDTAKENYALTTGEDVIYPDYDSSNTYLNYFVDVPTNSYYYDAVLWAIDQGITVGTDSTHFSPNDSCTRAQAVTFLWRAAGCPVPKSATMPFTDVASDAYYYDAVLWAVENNIAKGTEDRIFNPDATCSRAQIVTFLWRSQNAPAAGITNQFTDVVTDAYYTDAVLWAVKENVTRGTSDTTFSPDDDCTRAQIVTFLWRTMA